MPYETIRVEATPDTAPEDGIRMLVMNRPEVMNSMNTKMFIEMRDAVRELAYEMACGFY